MKRILYNYIYGPPGKMSRLLDGLNQTEKLGAKIGFWAAVFLLLYFGIPFLHLALYHLMYLIAVILIAALAMRCAFFLSTFVLFAVIGIVMISAVPTVIAQTYAEYWWHHDIFAAFWNLFGDSKYLVLIVVQIALVLGALLTYIVLSYTKWFLTKTEPTTTSIDDIPENRLFSILSMIAFLILGVSLQITAHQSDPVLLLESGIGSISLFVAFANLYVVLILTLIDVLYKRIDSGQFFSSLTNQNANAD